MSYLLGNWEKGNQKEEAKVSGRNRTYDFRFQWDAHLEAPKVGSPSQVTNDAGSNFAWGCVFFFLIINNFIL